MYLYVNKDGSIWELLWSGPNTAVIRNAETKTNRWVFKDKFKKDFGVSV